jgi:hypothetical protein
MASRSLNRVKAKIKGSKRKRSIVIKTSIQDLEQDPSKTFEPSHNFFKIFKD